MNAADSQVLPAPPNLIRALLAGFDTVANHLGLILFSISIDIILWFGPQVRVVKSVTAYLDWTIKTAAEQTPQMAEALRSSSDSLLSVAERFNLLSSLRSMPVGIASLMAGRAPLMNPLFKSTAWEMPSLASIFLLWVGLRLFGLLLGTMLFQLIFQASLLHKVSLAESLRQLPRRFFQVILLTLFLFSVLLASTLPLWCILPFLLAGGANLGRFAIFIYGAVLIWLLFPLVLSPFGIFVHQDKMWTSVLRGARLARFTMPTTLLFALVIIVLSQGLDMLWSMPIETSWFSLVGVIGHAFVATSLLAAGFIYYRDAANFVQQRLQKNN
jgi:hypothetical protein